CAGKDFGEEFFAPSAAAAFHDDAVFARMLARRSVCDLPRSAMKQRQRLGRPARGWRARETQPVLQHARVDPPEINGRLEIAVLQVEQLGCFADEPGLYAGAGQEDRLGGAVVGSLRAVLSHPPPELAEAQH